MTECMPIASPPVGYRLQKRDSVGTPLGVELYIEDAMTGMPAVAGRQGEVVLRAAHQLFIG